MNKRNYIQLLTLVLGFVSAITTYAASTDKKKPEVLSQEDKWVDSAYAYVFVDQDKAISFGKKAIKRSRKTKKFKTEIWASNAVGNAYHVKADYLSAYKYYNAGLEIAGKKKFLHGEILCCVNLGYLFTDQKNYPLAKKYYHRGLKKALLDNDTANQGNIYNNLGVVFNDLRDYDSSLYYHKKALERRLKNKVPQRIAGSYTNLGTVYFALKDFDKAIEYQLKSFEIDTMTTDPTILINLAASYAQKEMHSKALFYYKKALAIGEENIDKRNLLDLYIDLYSIYGDMQNTEQALKYATLALDLKDTLSATDTRRMIGELNEKYQAEKRELEIKGLNAEKEKQDAELKRKSMMNMVFAVGIVFVLIFLVIVFRGYQQKKKSNEIISLQKLIVEEKQKEITDSISYARRIQFSLLADERQIKESLKDYFILFQPKDIVSGDFYWCTQKDGKFYLAVCDCTGHGVPGAFMSLLSISLLNEAINEKGIYNPAQVFDFVRKRIIKSLEGGKDGLDGILLSLDLKPLQLTAALANNPIWVVRNKQIMEITPDKMPVGSHDKENISFTSKEFTLEKNDLIILITDGFADQFGGDKGKKFKYSNLKDMLVKTSDLGMTEIRNELRRSLDSWRGDLEQVDDVCIIGIRI